MLPDSHATLGIGANRWLRSLEKQPKGTKTAPLPRLHYVGPALPHYGIYLNIPLGAPPNIDHSSHDL